MWCAQNLPFFPFHFYLTGQTLGVHIVFSTRGTVPWASSEYCSGIWHILSLSKSHSIRIVRYLYGNDPNSLRPFQTPPKIKKEWDMRNGQTTLQPPSLSTEPVWATPHSSAVPCPLPACPGCLLSGANGWCDGWVTASRCRTEMSKSAGSVTGM